MSKRGAQPKNGNSAKHKFYSTKGDTPIQGVLGTGPRPTATAGRSEPQVSPPPVAASQGPDGTRQPDGPAAPSPLPSLADIARDLHKRQQQLADYIINISTLAGEVLDDLPATTAYIAAQSLYGQNSARLARIIRANNELPHDGDGNESMSDAMNWALTEINRVKRKIKELAEERENL